MPKPLESFEATKPIPKLGIEVGDWVSIELGASPEVVVCKPQGPAAMAILRTHLLRPGREHLRLLR